MKSTEITYQKVVDILVFDEKHKLVLQQRSHKDISFPGHWDFSAGGHVEKGENFADAAAREVFEELGITGEIKFVTEVHFQYPAWKSVTIRNMKAALFRMTYNGPLQIDKKEVEKVVFRDLSSVQKMIDCGEKFHPEFLLAWERGLILKASQ